MTTQEICRSYREARNQKEQIGILADLNASSKERIVSVLRDGGENVDWFRSNTNAGRAWTEEEDEELLMMREARKTFREIAAAFRRTETAIRMRYAKLSGGKLVPDNAHWTRDEEKELLKLRQKGITFKAIGEMLGRTKNSVMGKYQRLEKGGR